MAHGSQHTKGENTSQKERPKKELSNKMLYLKTVFALVLGLVLGYFKVTGVVGFVAFAPFQFVLAQLYCSFYKVPDYLMDKMDMLTDQVFPALGVFLVTWTLAYTAFHW